MTAREESHSSKSFAYDASLLPPLSGPSHGRLHESSEVAADARSAASLIVHETSSSQQSNAAAGIKSNSIIPGNSCLRAERVVMQSCWIQRLTPACKKINYEEEKLKEPSHVWTHFTKDFSSCSKRLHKAGHNTRSSSWPPKERPPKSLPFPHRNSMELVDIKEQYLLSRVNREENLCVPFVDASETNDNCVRAGNLLLKQNSSCNSVSSSEALVPLSQHRDASRTCDESCEGKNREKGKLLGFAAQNFQCLSKDSERATSAVGGDFTLLGKPSLHPGFNREDGSVQEAASLRVLGDAPSKGKFAAYKLAHRNVHIGGSSPDAVIGTSLSPALMGASADADRIPLSPSLVKDANPLSRRADADGIPLSPSLVKDVNPLSPLADLSKFSYTRLCKTPSLRASPALLDCEASVPAVVFGDSEKEINQTELGVLYKKNSGIACDMKVKTRRNFGFLYFGGQSKDLNQPTANPHVFSGSCKGVGSDRFCVGKRGSELLTASKSIQRKTDVGASTAANNAVPFVSEQYNDSGRSFITELRRSGSIVADHPLRPKEELASKVPLTRVSSRDFTRHCLREMSQEDYGVQLFEDPGPVKPLETGSSTATLPRGHITEEFHVHHLNLPPNTLKIDGKEKLKYFSRASPYTPLNTNAQAHYSCNLPQQTQVSLRKSLIQTEQTCLGLNQGGLADRISLDGSMMPRKLQEKSPRLSKAGEMKRLDFQTDNKDLNFQPGLSNKAAAGVSMLFGHQSYKFCDDGRTSEASRLNQTWIQRWRSCSSLIAMSGNMISPSVGNDGDLGSEPAKVPVISSHREKKGRETESGWKCNKHMEGLPNFDSGSGSTPWGSFHAYRSRASFRGKYMAPSVEAMAIASNVSSKLLTTSLQNRGSFSVWSCPSADAVEQGKLAERAKETVDENMYGVDMDDLEFVEMQTS